MDDKNHDNDTQINSLLGEQQIYVALKNLCVAILYNDNDKTLRETARLAVLFNEHPYRYHKVTASLKHHDDIIQDEIKDYYNRTPEK